MGPSGSSKLLESAQLKVVDSPGHFLAGLAAENELDTWVTGVKADLRSGDKELETRMAKGKGLADKTT